MLSDTNIAYRAYEDLRNIAREVARAADLLEEVGLERLADRLGDLPSRIIHNMETLRNLSNKNLDEQLKHGQVMMGNMLKLAIHMDEQHAKS